MNTDHGRRLFEHFYPFGCIAVGGQKVLGQKAIPNMGFVVPQLFSKTETIVIDFRQFFIKELGDFTKLLIALGIACFDQTFVQLQGQVRELSCQIVLISQASASVIKAEPKRIAILEFFFKSKPPKEVSSNTHL